MYDLRWTYEGVNHSFAGNGGPECVGFLELTRRFWESVIACVIAIGYIIWGWKRTSLPRRLAANRDGSDCFGRYLLLVPMCLIFGCEVFFKSTTKTLIYLLNPCHVVTIVQIYLLVAPPSSAVTVLFRWQMHSLNGPFLALAFPVVNTRLLPFEMEIYYLQHGMMLIVPFYLLKIGGVYSVERIQDFSWSILTAGSWMLYHFLPLQLIGLWTEVNLNNMLCPAISDPFHGPDYRVWAFCHQTLMISLIGKVHYLISGLLLNWHRRPEAKYAMMSFCNDNSKIHVFQEGTTTNSLCASAQSYKYCTNDSAVTMQTHEHYKIE